MARKWSTALVAGLSVVMASAVVGPAAAQDSRQKDKNNMRNLGIGLGAAAAHQALKGKSTNALILGAGAAYAGKKYEDARKAQSEDNSWRRGRYDDDRRYDDDYRTGERRYDDRYRDGERVSYAQHDNGRKLGHYKQKVAKKVKHRR